MRPFIEANFSIFGISPSMLVGFSPEDRSFIFGQNPAISLLSFLTFGISNLVGINDVLKTGESNDSYSKYVAFVFVGALVWFALIYGFGNMIDLDKTMLYGGITIGALTLLFYIGLYGFAFKKPLDTILLAPILRWDVLYLLMKYGFGLAGLVFASFTIRDFQNIPADDACLFRDTHIRQLYIAFIFFLIVLYTFNTLSASNLTSLTTGIMRYLVPPALLGMTSYLVFITNYFVKLSPQLVVN
jgi:energy-coupling factor transporter transmembrane protein EcfT